VHPTLAGVLMGLLAPARPHTPPELVDAEELADLSTVEHARSTVQLARRSVSTVEWLEHVLHPWTSYLIVPLFALANSGIEVSVDRLTSALDSPVTWGVFVGLVLGKPIGVLLATSLARRGGIAEPPDGTTTTQLLGVGNAAGIGFTVAIFIAELAFTSADTQADAKMAILAASVLSGVLAFGVLRRGRPSPDAQRLEPTKLS
jgi:NhaA family Na+:H+ antiporter